MSEERDELMERLLAGEVDLDHPEVRAASEDPAFVERLDETCEVLAALELLAEAQSRRYHVKAELLANSDLDLLRGRPEFRTLAE